MSESTSNEDVLPGVQAIDLRFMGQPGCIAAYLLKGADGAAALIETGPSSTRAALLDGLRAAGIDPTDVRDILVTHTSTTPALSASCCATRCPEQVFMCIRSGCPTSSSPHACCARPPASTAI